MFAVIKFRGTRTTLSDNPYYVFNNLMFVASSLASCHYVNTTRENSLFDRNNADEALIEKTSSPPFHMLLAAAH